MTAHLPASSMRSYRSSWISALKPFGYFVAGHFSNQPASTFIEADQSASAPICLRLDDEVICFAEHERNDKSLGRKRKIMRKADSSPRQVLAKDIDLFLRKWNPARVYRHELHLTANWIAISKSPLASIRVQTADQSH